jgi:bifunctional DNA-binding transcriptional regulator/antitoxin component of YhaV-PrlF toxin-antitoxin module
VAPEWRYSPLATITPRSFTVSCARTGIVSYNGQSDTYNDHVTTHVMTVSGNGQVSIPAGTRARWKTRKVIVVDLGDRVVMRPAPSEPVEKLEGKYRTRGPSSDQARRQARRDDAARAGAR